MCTTAGTRAFHAVLLLAPQIQLCLKRPKEAQMTFCFFSAKKHLQTLTGKNGLHFRDLFIHPKLKRFKSLNKMSEWGSLNGSLWNALFKRQTSDASEQLVSGTEGSGCFSRVQLKQIRASDWLTTQQIMPSTALQSASPLHGFVTASASNCSVKYWANHQVYE